MMYYHTTFGDPSSNSIENMYMLLTKTKADEQRHGQMDIEQTYNPFSFTGSVLTVSIKRIQQISE